MTTLPAQKAQDSQKHNLLLKVSVTPTPVQVAKEQLLLEGELKPFHSVVLRLPVTDETHIAPALDRVAEVLGNLVSIGSYPVSSCCTFVSADVLSVQAEQATCSSQVSEDVMTVCWMLVELVTAVWFRNVGVTYAAMAVCAIAPGAVHLITF